MPPIKTTTLFVLSAVVTAAVALGVGLAFSGVVEPDRLRHDSNRWAVIEDIRGDRIAVETTDDGVWAQLVAMHANATERWVGGPVERYANGWGFRFRPDALTVAEVTAEGLQATIRDIGADLDYWLEVGIAYVGAQVVETHEAG
ncbi:MAG: hypothetical protein ACT4OI_06530 [Methanobacteriota archaeon]